MELLVGAHFVVERACRLVGSLVVDAAQARPMLGACRLDFGPLGICQSSPMHNVNEGNVPNAARMEEMSGCAMFARGCVLMTISQCVDEEGRRGVWWMMCWMI